MTTRYTHHPRRHDRRCRALKRRQHQLGMLNSGLMPTADGWSKYGDPGDKALVTKIAKAEAEIAHLLAKGAKA